MTHPDSVSVRVEWTLHDYKLETLYNYKYVRNHVCSEQQVACTHRNLRNVCSTQHRVSIILVYCISSLEIGQQRRTSKVTEITIKFILEHTELLLPSHLKSIPHSTI